MRSFSDVEMRDAVYRQCRRYGTLLSPEQAEVVESARLAGEWEEAVSNLVASLRALGWPVMAADEQELWDMQAHLRLGDG